MKNILDILDGGHDVIQIEETEHKGILETEICIRNFVSNDESTNGIIEYADSTFEKLTREDVKELVLSKTDLSKYFEIQYEDDDNSKYIMFFSEKFISNINKFEVKIDTFRTGSPAGIFFSLDVDNIKPFTLDYYGYIVDTTGLHQLLKIAERLNKIDILRDIEKGIKQIDTFYKDSNTIFNEYINALTPEEKLLFYLGE